jgi:abequosyltransferase
MAAVAQESRIAPPVRDPLARPLLTIAVPTYNRAGWLSRSLPEVLAQAAAEPAGRVEVVVSDNRSTDRTWDLLQRAAASHPFLRLHRNDQNLGGEANFRLLPRLAQGRFVWVLGDDDILLPGAVRRVVDLIGRGYEYIATNCMLFDETMQVCIRERKHRHPRDIELHGVTDVLRHVQLDAGYISCNIARREFFGNTAEDDFHRCAQWGLSFLMDLYVGLRGLRKGVFLSSPLFRGRRMEAWRSPDGFNYFTWFLEGPNRVFEVLARDHGYSRRAIRRIKSGLLWRLAWKRIAYERMQGTLDGAVARRVLRRGYGTYPAYWLLCAPLLYLPGVGPAVRLAVRLRGGARARRLLGRGEG